VFYGTVQKKNIEVEVHPPNTFSAETH